MTVTAAVLLGAVLLTGCAARGRRSDPPIALEAVQARTEIAAQLAVALDRRGGRVGGGEDRATEQAEQPERGGGAGDGRGATQPDRAGELQPDAGGRDEGDASADGKLTAEQAAQLRKELEGRKKADRPAVNLLRAAQLDVTP